MKLCSGGERGVPWTKIDSRVPRIVVGNFARGRCVWWSRSDFVDAPTVARNTKPRSLRHDPDRGGTRKEQSIAFDNPSSYALLLLLLLLLSAGLIECVNADLTFEKVRH